MRRFEELRIWQEARLLVKEIYLLMLDNRDWGFKDQIQRASVSIMNNIAEGSDFGSDSGFIRYLNIAQASCSELKSMLYICEDLNYCTNEKAEELRSKVKNIAASISKLISYLKLEKE